MMIVQCKQCGMEFRTIPARVKDGRGKFCSRSCTNAWRSEHERAENSPAWRGGGIRQTCEMCGEEFVAKRTEVDKGWGRFCSRKCQGEWQSRARTGENAAAWNGGPVACVCEICGVPFSVRPALIKKRSGRFCSNKCRGAWIARAWRGENSPTWKGGYVPAPYPPEFTNAFKKRIRERDGERCAVCRFPGKAVHHIDYDKGNTTDGNCIVLCKRCHNKTNYHRPYWQRALSELLAARLTGANP